MRAKGEIACSQIGTSVASTALVRPYHLSYPHIFEHGGNLWMLPETTENHSVELYRCVDFPNKWELDTTLLRGLQASDPTLIEHGGLLWLFASDFQKRTKKHRLHLWHSSSLHGPWEPHCLNPVFESRRGARPGGKIFSCQDSLIRPAQDCTRGYGVGLEFRRIVELDPAHYADEVVGAVQSSQFPGWNGMHTYNRSADYEAIDGRVGTIDWRGKLEGVVGKTLRSLHR